MVQLYASQSRQLNPAPLFVASDHDKAQRRRKYVFTDQIDIRRFVLEHPTDIDLRKVDQLWFSDVITNRLVRAGLNSSSS